MGSGNKAPWHRWAKRTKKVFEGICGWEGKGTHAIHEPHEIPDTPEEHQTWTVSAPLSYLLRWGATLAERPWAGTNHAQIPVKSQFGPPEEHWHNRMIATGLSSTTVEYDSTKRGTTVMSSPCPREAGSLKKEKMAGLLPGGERAVCTEVQDEKALYKDHSILASSPAARDTPPSGSSFSTGHPQLAAEAP